MTSAKVELLPLLLLAQRLTGGRPMPCMSIAVPLSSLLSESSKMISEQLRLRRMYCYLRSLATDV